jgi:hypothetical protein
MPVPTDELANVATAVPPNVTSSILTIPFNAAVPDKVAEVLPS